MTESHPGRRLARRKRRIRALARDVIVSLKMGADSARPVREQALPDDSEPAVEPLLVDRPIDEAERLPFEWLWPGRIPLGALTLIAGDEGAGKSLVALDIAARVSCGKSWPDAPDAPQDEGNVLVLAAYDSLLGTALPRLRQAGSNLHRTFYSDGLEGEALQNGLRRRIRFPDDLRRLERTIIEHNPMRLVVIDPIWAFCSRAAGHATDPATLGALAKLAADCEVAIVGLTGLRRGRGGLAYQVAGDKGLVAAARAAWGLVRHPGKEGLRVLLPIKTNIGPEQKGLDFRIVDGRVEWDQQPTKLTARAAIAAERSAGRRDSEEQWLRSFLSSGSRPAREIMEQAKECGISKWGLERAKIVVGISVQKHGFNGDTHWRWSLDDNSAKENGND